MLFRLNATRESVVVREVLGEYAGILITTSTAATMPYPVDSKNAWSTSFETSTMTFGVGHSTPSWKRSCWMCGTSWCPSWKPPTDMA